MPLVRGDRLGPFEITAHIGSGGMGEVYRARDTHLNRDVAIKVLPELFARDPERLARFTREAQTLASLNHTNVAQVFGVQDQALIMEFVDGEDLAQRIARGPVPVADAIDMATQIARGLEAAHERGIVHRDLKPANVRITPDGVAKVLDFGLAKAEGTSERVPYNLENSPTFTSPPTEMGMILGTAGYMAPEQARGKPVDKRADIWAFGCVLYEMLTAKRPFGGETVTDTLAAIVREDPDWAALPAHTPTVLRELLARCLVKDPKSRLRDIGDARIALEQAIADPTGGTRAPAAAAPTSGRALAVVATALPVAAIASLVTWLLVRPAPAPPLPLSRFATPLPLDALPLRTGGTGVAFAPDGTSVVYAAHPALTAAPVLFQRRLNAVDVEKVPNTNAGTAPFFSPDSRWIGFITDTAVMKVSIDGQGLAKICERTRFSRGAWAPDGTIILGTSQIHSNGPLAKVSAGGGTPADLTRLTGNEMAHQLPHVLPDGRHVLFSVVSPGRSELAIVPLAGGTHKLLGIEGSGAIFVPPGHLLYARGRTMFAVPFDPRSNEVRENPNQVLDDVGVFSGAANVWVPLAAVDRAGSIAYLNRGGTLSTLRWIAPTSVPVSVPEGDYRTPKLSPDGRRVVVAANAAPSEIWVIDLDRGTRLLLATGGGTAPIWSHDGQRIVYLANSGEIMRVPADGSGMPETVLARQPSISVAPTAVAPDGSFIVASAENRGSSPAIRNRDIWIIRPGQKPEPIVATPADERGGAVSPDSKWLAYSSSVSGREEVYIKSLADSGRTIPVSADGGILPRWPRMDSLYFLGPRTLMRAPISGDPLAAGAPVEVTVVPQNMGGFDIDRDGRILIIEPRAGATGTRDALHVLLNWGPSLAAGR
jgi:Tol biopolymer transport system component/predicted Ser/Thr protein kinase